VREVFSTPLKTAVLYKEYLRVIGQKGKRYDPYVMNLGRVLPVFAKADPKNIGIVVATINMKHPGVQHLGGERELRVPPEAIVSVDKFIG
jgi:hypothetical protein